jgi:hypothetical protein
MIMFDLLYSAFPACTSWSCEFGTDAIYIAIFAVGGAVAGWVSRMTAL